MILTSELLDSNAVGVIGAALVTALFALVSTVLVVVVQGRHQTSKVKDVAQQAVDNTNNVSNGFTDRMDRQLNTVIQNQNELSEAFRDHLAWHLRKETPK